MAETSGRVVEGVSLRSIAKIVVSNSAWCMDVCLLWVLCVAW